MVIDKIDGSLLKKAIINSAFVLSKNKKIVDALNVFPVPDGDTGTNMSLTMDQAAKELKALESDDLKKVADTAAWGSLMGARGNSGVILSQLFRGFAQGVTADKKYLTPQECALAYKSGVEAAYHAVMRPAEGTILTVARETAEKMLSEAKKTSNMEVILTNTLEYGEKVLNKTPEMLKALKEANVVDAGGKGLIYIITGVLEAIKNPDTDFALLEVEEGVLEEETSIKRDISQDIKYAYCTELFIKGKNISTEGLKDYLSQIGDSLIVIGTGELVKLHVHTNNPDLVLKKALSLGELSKIKIDNMKIQHEEIINKPKNGEDAMEEELIQEEGEVKKPIGIIAISQGTGINEIFKSIGADIIEGGQTMNPSTENILSIVEKKSYDDTIILPNNKNIILTAEQVKQLSKKRIHVVPTRSVPQGISALLAFDPGLSIKENLENMTESIKNVTTGEVTFAVRDTQWNGTNIKEGDILGIIDGKLSMVSKDREEVLVKLVEEMTKSREDGIITIYYGSEVEEDLIQNIVDDLTQKYKDFDVECYSGGQSLYHYIMSVE